MIVLEKPTVPPSLCVVPNAPFWWLLAIGFSTSSNFLQWPTVSPTEAVIFELVQSSEQIFSNCDNFYRHKSSLAHFCYRTNSDNKTIQVGFRGCFREQGWPVALAIIFPGENFVIFRVCNLYLKLSWLCFKHSNQIWYGVLKMRQFERFKAYQQEYLKACCIPKA